jgi:hypothetical protein
VPTKRTIYALDYTSGSLKVTERIIPTGTVEERFSALRRVSQEKVGPGIEIMRVLCDGCGRSVQVDEPKLPEGWETNDRGEFCPRCR